MQPAVAFVCDKVRWPFGPTGLAVGLHFAEFDRLGRLSEGSDDERAVHQAQSEKADEAEEE